MEFEEQKLEFRISSPFKLSVFQVMVLMYQQFNDDSNDTCNLMSIYNDNEIIHIINWCAMDDKHDEVNW